MNKNFIKSLALAALLSCLYTVSAYAATLFNFSAPAQSGPLYTSSTATLTYTVTNTSSQPMPFLNVAFTTSTSYSHSPNPPDYSDCKYNGQPGLAGNSSCTIIVTLAAGPTATAVTGQQLSITSAQNSVSSSAPITIDIVSPTNTVNWGMVAAAPSSSSITVGGTSTVTYSVTNNATDSTALNITSLTPGSSNGSITATAGTQLGNACSTTASLAAGATCTYVVEATAIAAGSANVTLDIATSNGTPQTNTVPSSSITVTAANASWTFGTAPTATSVTIGDAATNLTYTVSNTSSSTALTFDGSSFAVTPSNANISLGTATNTCGSSLAPSQSCTYTVPVTGVTAGTATVQLTVAPTNGAPTSSAQTSGTVTVNSANSTWTLGINQQPTPSSIQVGGTSQAIFLVTNNASSPLNITSTAILTSVPNVVTTSIDPSSTCSTTTPLAGNGTCTFVVNAVGTAVTSGVTLQFKVVTATSGSHMTNPSSAITVTSASATWGFGTAPVATSVTVGDSPANLAYTIQNTSTTTALTFDGSSFAATASNANITLGTATNTCGSSLATGQSCTYTVPVTGVTGGTTATVQLTVAPTNGSPTSSAQTSGTITVNNINASWTLGIQQQPTPSSIQIGDTSQSIFLVTNNASTPLSISSTQILTSVSNVVTTSIDPSSTCSTTTPLAGNGTCTFVINAVGSAATSGVTLQFKVVTATNGSHMTNPSNAITVTATTAALYFVQQPQMPNTSPGGALTLDFVVGNNSSTPVPLTTQDITFNPVAGQGTAAAISGETVSILNCANNTVPANGQGTCDVRVAINISSTAAAGAVQQAMNIAYNSGNSTLPANIQFNVASLDLKFSAEPTQAVAITMPNYQTINYTVTNTTNSPIVINSVALAPTSTVVGLYDAPQYNCMQGNVPTVPANGVCAITVDVQGLMTGVASEQLSVDYVGSHSPLLSSSLAYTVSNSTQAAFSFTQQPMANNMNVSTSQTLDYQVQNNGGQQVSINVSLSPSSTLLSGETLSICGTPASGLSGSGIVAANGTCDIVVTLNSGTQFGTVDQTLDVTPTGGATLASPITFQVISMQNARTITFTNNCSSTVWVGLSAASVANVTSPASPVNTSCSSNSDCFPGSSCVTTGTNPVTKQCYWINPTPVLNPNNPGNKTGNAFELQTGDSSTITVPDPGNTNTTVNGEMNNLSIAARTGCNQGGQCQTADCSGGTFLPGGACKPGVGFSPPMTKGELNLYNGIKGIDFYDVAVIDGYNVPFTITPGAGNTPDNTGSPYSCGSAGGLAQQGSTPNAIGACTWNFQWNVSQSFNPNMRMVPPGGASCSVDTDCSNSNQICGMSQSSITAAGGNPVPKTCGTFLGYWSVGYICSLDPNAGAPFNCAAPTPHMTGSFSSGYTMANLFQCNGPTGKPGISTCNNSNSVSNQCCGCVNWSQVSGITLPTSTSFVTPCGDRTPLNPAAVSSTDWTSNVQPFAQVYKTGCASAYSYQFDDPTSTFTCTNNSFVPNPPPTVPNTLGYTVTFCPANTNAVASAANPNSATVLRASGAAATTNAKNKASQLLNGSSGNGGKAEQIKGAVQNKQQ